MNTKLKSSLPTLFIFFSLFIFFGFHDSAWATCYDGNGDPIEEGGCTDSAAGNYDSCATYSDNSCTYPGCTNSLACNYNQGAVGDDGSCEYDSCKPCPSGTSGNYPECFCSNGAVNPDGGCSDCGMGMEMADGECVTACSPFEIRNNAGVCVDAVCANGAVDPVNGCTTCGQGQTMVDGQCTTPTCPAGTTGTPPSCTCTNGANDPTGCTTCPTGQEMYGGTCVDECPANTSRDSSGACVCQNGSSNPPTCSSYCTDEKALNYGLSLPCKYDGTSCCPAGTTDANGNPALNADPNCPDPTATPPKNGDASVCSFCGSGSQDAQCRVPFCGDPLALNADDEATCEAFNPGLNCVETSQMCLYRTAYYCSDPNGIGPNTETLARCTANKTSPNDQCLEDNSLCDYQDKTYCGDDRAGNYDAGGAQCQADNPGSNCTADNNTCAYAYCSVGFSLNVECPSGFKFKTPDNQSYVYTYQYSPFDPYDEVCEGFSYEETDYLKGYFEQKYCGIGDSVACQGGFCGQIDWCPTIPGKQTDPTECVDVCPNKPGIQRSESQCNSNNLCVNLGNIPLPSGYYLNSQTNQCLPCKNGVCTPGNGVCGTATTADFASNINGSRACLSGTKSVVTKTGTLFTWSCLGNEGGMDQGCQANLVCSGGLTYCENKGICSDKCYVGNDCANSNICVFKGGVSLNKKLDVTPIVDRDGTCEISLDKTAEVFDAFDVTTHCTLSSQDAVITTFDPANLTTDGVGVTNYLMPNIKKDMTYTLKCHDGDVTATTTYETSIGSCRLNLKTLEAN
ncbi:MAG: EGF-like domain protein [Candidatus Taylorbacteria bacterium]|nr:EGF-like domain protein [Candidatus Taylorbacteria bacterium]